MRILNVTNTQIDTSTQVLPFTPNNTVVVGNVSGGSLTLQDSVKGDGSDWATLAVCAAGFTEVSLRNQYIRVSTAATLTLMAD